MREAEEPRPKAKQMQTQIMNLLDKKKRKKKTNFTVKVNNSKMDQSRNRKRQITSVDGTETKRSTKSRAQKRQMVSLTPITRMQLTLMPKQTFRRKKSLMVARIKKLTNQDQLLLNSSEEGVANAAGALNKLNQT
jgi:hypothetical protein